MTVQSIIIKIRLTHMRNIGVAGLGNGYAQCLALDSITQLLSDNVQSISGSGNDINTVGNDINCIGNDLSGGGVRV